MAHAFGVSQVLVGSSAEAEGSASGSLPAAASRRGKYRSQTAPAVSLPLPPFLRETPSPWPDSTRDPCLDSPFNIKERPLIGRLREAKPHPVTQDPSLIGLTSCHPAFLPVNWPYGSPAPLASCNPIRVTAAPKPAPALFLLVSLTVIIITSKEWAVAFAAIVCVFGTWVSVPLSSSGA